MNKYKYYISKFTASTKSTVEFLGKHPFATGLLALLSIFGLIFSIAGYRVDRDYAEATTMQVELVERKLDDIAKTINKKQHSPNPKSVNELVINAKRIVSLPPDILKVIKPGVNIPIIKEILGNPNKQYETKDAKVYKYNFDSSELGVLSTNHSEVDAVYVMGVGGSQLTPFYFPDAGELKIDLKVGVSSWNDAIREFRHAKPLYTYAGRWSKAFVEFSGGAEGNYLHYVAGSQCNMPEFDLIEKRPKAEFFLADNEPARITDSGDNKITFVAISNTVDVLLDDYNFLPICF